MTKIKIFNETADRAEIKIDEWIKKENPNIIQISTTGKDEYTYVLTVLYKDQQSISLNS